MAERSDWVVDGFQFGTQKDAELAKGEQLRIERLEKKLEYDNPQMIAAVYDKAIENRVFKTPVGYGFLKKLQMVLSEELGMEDVADIPVYGVYSLRETADQTVERVRASQKRANEKKRQELLSRRLSILANIILLALVAAMFLISATGSSPTVLNYERALQDRYAEWEQELSEREQAIRDKEKELLLAE